MMKKWFIFGGIGLLLSAGALFMVVRLNDRIDPNSLLAQNIEALGRGEPGLDANYTPDPYNCEIYVGAKGSLKLAGGSILNANAEGYVIFSGARDCISRGNRTCKPIDCTDLYSAIL